MGPYSFTAYEKAIISILDAWSEPMHKDTLSAILEATDVFSLDPQGSLTVAIDALCENQVIYSTQSGLMLSSRNNPYIAPILDDQTNQLYYKTKIYEFLVRHKDASCNVRLRYELSKDTGRTTRTDARLYLRQLLSTGENIPPELMLEAKIDKGEWKDCLLAAVVYCRARKYEKAFDWLDKIPSEVQINNEWAILRAILLNRLRRSEEAETELLRCLGYKEESYRQNILGAYLISTYIHMEKLPTARAVYENMHRQYAGTHMHGYLLRNATSAFSEYREELYTEALATFEADGDWFGYYTTLCNQGYALCKNGGVEAAIPLLEKAKEGLKDFPETNLHIVYNDLGICYFLSQKYHEARRCLELAKILGENTMPRIFSMINLACVDAVTGKTEDALKELDDIEKEVIDHPLDRVRQKYFINRLLVEYLHGNKNLGILIEHAKAYPDRYYPEHTEKSIQVYVEFSESLEPADTQKWVELFSPCGLAYWYLDPLKIFSTIAVNQIVSIQT